MPRITYFSQHFPPRFGPHLNGYNTIDVPWSELVWAAISVGKPEASHLVKHGVLSWYELLMRVYLLRVNFKESGYPLAEFEQTQVYKTLDPSEKTSLSYFMGLTTAKLLTNRFLGVSWLVHLDSFAKARLKFTTRKRPDLLGLNHHRKWLVMEAKGRSGALPKDLISKALIQTGALSTIDGHSPFLRVACASHASYDRLAAHWECPIAPVGSVEDLELSPLEFLDQYYASIRNLISRNNQGAARVQKTDEEGVSYLLTTPFAADANSGAGIQQRVLRFDTVSLPDLDLTIGLLDRPNSFFLENPEWHEALLTSEKYRGQLNSFNREVFIASDGILVQLGPSWNGANMGEEPSQRTYQ